MIDGLKPYPDIKASGVPWLGDLPVHWESLPLKYWVRMNRAVLPETTAQSYEFRYLDIGSVGTGVLTAKPQPMSFAAAPSRARRIVREGDTIISTVRTYLKAVYFVECNAQELVCSTGFAVLTPAAETVPRFASYLCQSSPFTDRITADSVGIAYPAIAEARLGGFHVPVPPPCEQAAIVRFLNHADRKIRRYIRTKQQLIKLLEEQKQVIIHRAVTRGLDPKVQLKPSGVDWLGDVPEHWAVKRTKNLFRLRTQKSGRAHELELLSIYTHIGVRPRKDLEEKGNKASTTDDYWIVRKGDLIVNKLLAWMGAVGMSEYEGVTSPAYDILTPIRELCPTYYHHLFRTKLLLQQFKQRSRGIMDMRLRLYFDQLGQIPIMHPPLSEQFAIVAYCESATSGLDQAITTARLEITLLHEYRTRLIADVVTGKLDVREAAAGLPEAVMEEEFGADELDEDLEVAEGGIDLDDIGDA
jgi:type I restriction enzyme S subunit